MYMVSLDLVWAGCPYALWYVVALTITLYQSDPACHYFVVCIYMTRNTYFYFLTISYFLPNLNTVAVSWLTYQHLHYYFRTS